MEFLLRIGESEKRGSGDWGTRRYGESGMGEVGKFGNGETEKRGVVLKNLLI
jgi:hypothetical protein